MIAMLLEDMIEEFDCVVIGPAAGVAHAIELISANAVDAAVLDVNLRGELSYAVADELAARRLPFLFITGYGQAGLDSVYDGRPVLQKPFTQDVLKLSLEVLFFG